MHDNYVINSMLEVPDDMLAEEKRLEEERAKRENVETEMLRKNNLLKLVIRCSANYMSFLVRLSYIQSFCWIRWRIYHFMQVTMLMQNKPLLRRVAEVERGGFSYSEC